MPTPYARGEAMIRHGQAEPTLFLVAALAALAWVPSGTGEAACEVSCNAMVSRSGTAGRPVAFIGDAAAVSCGQDLTYHWSFSGGVESTARDPVHVFTGAGDHQWTFTATAGSDSCTQSGTVSVTDPGPPSRAYVPAVAHAPGAEGTAWRTDMAIVNLSGATTEVTLTFVPYEGGAHTVRAAELAHGEIREWRDVLVALFGVGTGESAKGTIRLDADAAVYATSRTYNETPSGTFGQYMPALAASDCLSVDEPGVVLLLRDTDAFRSNLGLLNASTASCEAEVELIDGDGAALGPAKSWWVSAGRYWQQDSVFAAFGAANEDVAYARVTPRTPGCSMWAYGSVVDNASGDPTTVSVVSPGTLPTTFVAAVAHAPGSGGTEWRTDLAVGNPGTLERTVAFTFVPYGGGAPVVRTAAVPAGGARVWTDALVDLFGVSAAEATKGTLQVSSDVPLRVTSRTYNDTGSDTYGQAIPALTRHDCLTGGDVGVVPQLRKSADFRSNLGILNTGATDATVAIRLHGEDGTPIGSTLIHTVPAGQYWQRDDIFTGVGAAGRPLAYATVHLLTPEATVWGYGSVIDQATGDPTTVPMLVGGVGAAIDRTGTYNVRVGAAPGFTMELEQTGTAVDFTLHGKNVELAGTGTVEGDELVFVDDLPGSGIFTMSLRFTNHGQAFVGWWEADTEVASEGTTTGTRGPWPTRNVDALGVPRFVTTSGINLETIQKISKFRSGEGHDFSDDFEDCRSMKHYYLPTSGTAFDSVAVRAPFDAVVIGYTDEYDETLWKGTAIGLRSVDHPAFSMTLFHIDAGPRLYLGRTFSAGEPIGTSEKQGGTATDFAMWVTTSPGSRLVSYFQAMTDTAFSEFQARGVAIRDEFIITQGDRDANPLQCNGEQFQGTGNLDNWVELN